MTLAFPKPVQVRDRRYLDYLRTEPCIVTGLRASESDAVDPVHIGTAGKASKTHDSEALPILHSVHREMHQHGEMTVLRRMLPDWLLRECLRAYARDLYRQWKEQGT